MRACPVGRVSSDSQVGTHRVMCPALLGKARCPFRQKSMSLDFSRPEVLEAPAYPPTCCVQQAITLKEEVISKTAQHPPMDVGSVTTKDRLVRSIANWSWRRWRWRALPACTCVRSARHVRWGWPATWCLAPGTSSCSAPRPSPRVRPPRPGALFARLCEQRGCRCLRWHAYQQHGTDQIVTTTGSSGMSGESSRAQ